MRRNVRLFTPHNTTSDNQFSTDAHHDDDYASLPYETGHADASNDESYDDEELDEENGDDHTADDGTNDETDDENA